MSCGCDTTCHEELARIREENAALRASARTFGDLAERLNAELKRERLLLTMIINAMSQGQTVRSDGGEKTRLLRRSSLGS